MVLSDLSLEQMMEKIEFIEFTRFDYIIPTEYQGCSLFKMKPPVEFNRPPLNLSEIPPNSDLWMHFTEEKYSGPLEIISRYNELSGRTGKRQAGEGIICKILENAFYHGNQNNPLLPVSVKVFEGKKGMIIRVRDSGIGFDFKKVIDTVHAAAEKDPWFGYKSEWKKEEKYFKRAGEGFRGYHFHLGTISFENNGTIVNLMLLFDYQAK